MRIFLFISFIFGNTFLIPSLFSLQLCLPAREYITTLTYLREHPDFKLDEKSARTLSEQIASVCPDGAKYFIGMSEMLLSAGFGAKMALQNSKEMAMKGSVAQQAFMALFKDIYLEKRLDLDAALAYKTALEFSSTFKGDLSLATSDFHEITDYCLEKGPLELPRKNCLEMALSVALLTEKFKTSLAKTYKESMEFLLSSKGPSLPLFEAITLNKKIIEHGPHAGNNFKESFQFALKEKGLGMSIKEATSFAEQIAKKSYKE